MNRLLYITTPIFAVGLLTSLAVLLTQPNAPDTLSQLIAGFCLDGLFFVGLIELASRRQAAINESARISKLKLSMESALSSLTLILGDARRTTQELGRLRVEEYYSDILRIKRMAELLLPSAASIDPAHLRVWMTLVTLLHRLSEKPDTSLQSLVLDLRAAIAEFGALK